MAANRKVSKPLDFMTIFKICSIIFKSIGLMTCYVMLSKLEKSKGRFDYFNYVFFRYSKNK
jgi:hypothetical protein